MHISICYYVINIDLFRYHYFNSLFFFCSYRVTKERAERLLHFLKHFVDEIFLLLPFILSYFFFSFMWTIFVLNIHSRTQQTHIFEKKNSFCFYTKLIRLTINRNDVWIQASYPIIITYPLYTFNFCVLLSANLQIQITFHFFFSFSNGG